MSAVGTDVVAHNLVRNYSPHLEPNTREAPAAVELRNILSMTARDMLESYLRKWRRKLAVDAGAPNVQALQMVSVSMAIRTLGLTRGKVVDTVLAKLHVSAGKLPDLNSLIDQPNSILLSEIEPVLVRSRHIGVLTKLYRHHGDDIKSLDAWTKLADGEWTDADVQDPLTQIFDLLSEKKDRALIQKWIGWLVKKDSERALKVRYSLLVSRRVVQ